MGLPHKDWRQGLCIPNSQSISLSESEQGLKNLRTVETVGRVRPCSQVCLGGEPALEGRGRLGDSEPCF